MDSLNTRLIRILSIIFLFLFVVDTADAQRRSARQRTAREEAAEQTQEMQDPLLEEYGFDTKAALADFLLGKSLSRSEKKLVGAYKSGKDLSTRQTRTLTALLDKHKGAAVAEAEEEAPSDSRSARRRAARTREGAARERSAREGDMEMPDMSDLPGDLQGLPEIDLSGAPAARSSGRRSARVDESAIDADNLEGNYEIRFTNAYFAEPYGWARGDHSDAARRCANDIECEGFTLIPRYGLYFFARSQERGGDFPTSLFSAGAVALALVGKETICHPSVTEADAGEDQSGLSWNRTELTANAPANNGSDESGRWSIISGDGGSLAEPSVHDTRFTGEFGESYRLRWTVTNACGTSSDDVMVSFRAGNELADAQEEAVHCHSGRDGRRYCHTPFDLVETLRYTEAIEYCEQLEFGYGNWQMPSNSWIDGGLAASFRAHSGSVFMGDYWMLSSGTATMDVYEGNVSWGYSPYSSRNSPRQLRILCYRPPE